MKYLFLTCLGVTLSAQLFSQHHLSVTANGGVGKMTVAQDFIYQAESSGRLEESLASTGGFSLNYAFKMGDFSLETGLGYNQIKGNQSETFTITTVDINSVNTLHAVNLQTFRKAHYLDVPLTFNYQLDEFRFGVGAYARYLITNSTMLIAYSDNDLFILQNSGNNLSTFDFGLTANLSYKIGEKYDLMLSVNHGLSNVSNGTEQGAKYFTYGLTKEPRELRNRQFMLGIKYHIF